jgi:hypothetical protein
MTDRHERRGAETAAKKIGPKPDYERLACIRAPRIEIILTTEGASAGEHITEGLLFDAWMVVHIPDGGPPDAYPLDGGPFDKDAAVDLMMTIREAIGRQFSTPEAKRGLG